MVKRDSCPWPHALEHPCSCVCLHSVRSLWAQEDILTWVQATPSKPAQGTRTPGFLPVVLRARVDCIPGSVHLRVDYATSLHIFRPRDSSWWDVDGVWAWRPYWYAQAPCSVCVWGWGRRRSRWAACWGPALLILPHSGAKLQGVQEILNLKLAFPVVMKLYLSR